MTRFELANYDLEGHFHHHYGPTRSLTSGAGHCFVLFESPVEIAVILVLCYVGFRRRLAAGQRVVLPAVVALATCECSLLHELLLW